jgi:hypothetical protein
MTQTELQKLAAYTQTILNIQQIYVNITEVRTYDEYYEQLASIFVDDTDIIGYIRDNYYRAQEREHIILHK